MNAVTAAHAAVATVKIVRSITSTRAHIKKMRAERQFWIDLKNSLETAAEKPQPIRVACERLA